MTRKKNRTSKRKSKESFQEKYKKLSQKLLNLLDRDPSKGFTQRQIFSILRISQPSQRKQMKVMLEKLIKQGINIDDLPKDKAWLWRESYLKDPDGNQLILYKAGENRKNPPWRI